MARHIVAVDANVQFASRVGLVIVAAMWLGIASASDPDPLQDFCIADMTSNVRVNGMPCKDPAAVVNGDFKSSILATAGDPSGSPYGTAITMANVTTFPGLNTQGVAVARIDFGVGGVDPPHWHLRASEVLVCQSGTLLVGFVDQSRNLWTNTLNPGEAAVFPRGLLHFQYNVGKGPAVASVSFNSQNPGRENSGSSTFGSGIPTVVLQKSFPLSPFELDQLRKFFTVAS